MKQAKGLLTPEVASEHDAALLDVEEFLDHNELGIAFDWLKSIARESQWDSGILLETLCLAAENMERVDDARALKERLSELPNRPM